MDVAYVTKYTYTGLSKHFIKDNDEISLDRIFSILYEECLRSIINENEARRLYVQKLMIEHQFERLKISQKKILRQYVFKVGNPKFHSNNECQFLKSDFLNYRIPTEIEALGKTKVREFQEYCEANRKELLEKPDDVFWALVGARFHVNIRPHKITYANSGIQGVGKMSVDELRSFISEGIAGANQLLENPESGEFVARVRYAPHSDMAISKVKGDEVVREAVKAFFELKWRIIRSLFELYKEQSRSDGYLLPVSLLLSAGVEPCRACFGST